MLNNEDTESFRNFQCGKHSKWNFFGMFYRFNQSQNNISWECHLLCFSENRKGIYQIYPKIEEFTQCIMAKLKH